LHDRSIAGDKTASALLDVTTEIIKSWPSEWCLEANKLAIQVAGGAGYVQDYPLEQLYRDNRLNMIHEGTAGIHAITLLGRKVQGGKAEVLWEAMRTAADAAEALAADVAVEAMPMPGRATMTLTDCATALRTAVDRAEHVTAVLTATDLDKRAALTNAHDYLTLMGHTCIAWTWVRIATAATEAWCADLQEGGSATETAEAMYYAGKLHTCSYFLKHEMPKMEPLAATLLSLDAHVSEMKPGWF